MPNFRRFLKAFYALSKNDQGNLLREIYSYSKDVQIFLDNRLGVAVNFSAFLNAMERETIGKVYRKGTPGTPNGRVVNTIISKAKKAGAPLVPMLVLEQLAYRGFIEFLNEYGGGPESFDDAGARHLENYLRLVVDGNLSEEEKEQRITEVCDYLLTKNNMFTDYLDEVFENVTGRAVAR